MKSMNKIKIKMNERVCPQGCIVSRYMKQSLYGTQKNDKIQSKYYVNQI